MKTLHTKKPEAILLVDAPQYGLRMENAEPEDMQCILLVDKVLLRSNHYYSDHLVAFIDVHSTNMDSVAELRACAEKLSYDYEIAGVVGFSEASVLPSAVIAEWLGLPGIGVADAQRFRNKVRMAEVLRLEGVNCPTSFVAASEIDLKQAVAAIGG